MKKIFVCLAVVLVVAVFAVTQVSAENCAPESKGLKVYACKKGRVNDTPTCVRYDKVEAAGGCEYGPFATGDVDVVFVFAKVSDKDKVKNVYYNIKCDNQTGQGGGFEFSTVDSFGSGIGGDLDFIPDYSIEKLPGMSAGERRDRAKNDFEKKGDYLIKRISLKKPYGDKQFDKQVCTFGSANLTLLKLAADIK